MMTEQIITDLSDLRKYRTELPNVYDDAGLDVYEYRLLGHYKRVGTCTESIKTTAEKCDMSEGKVSECRQSLHDKGFIEAVKVPVPNGFSYRVNVVDMWLENFARYSGKSIQQIKDALDKLSMVHPSRGEGYPSHSEGKPSPGETKNTPPLIKNAFQLYEENIGPLTPIIADEIKDAEDFYTEEWVKDAIQESAVSNKRGWKYIAAILKARKERGGLKEKKSETPPAPLKRDLEKKLVTPEMFHVRD